VRVMATPGCSIEARFARFAECTEQTTTSDVFRASSCKNLPAKQLNIGTCSIPHVPSHSKKTTTKEPKLRTTPYPNGASAQPPERGGMGAGNAQQHGMQAAARELAESDARGQQRTHANPQAQRRLPQNLQPRKKGRQQGSIQYFSRSGNNPAGRRQDPGARACSARDPSQHQRSPHEAPDAPFTRRLPPFQATSFFNEKFIVTCVM
jgi:hypothetical protein